MILFSRTDTSLLARWWWTVDRWSLAAVSAIILLGTLLIMTASPAVAERIGADSYVFIYKHLKFLPLAVGALIATSLLSPKWVLRAALALFLAAFLGLIATFVFGVEVKGAQRWIRLAGFTVQPSEFIKPAVAIIGGWLMAKSFDQRGFPGKVVATGVVGLVLMLLLLQPDIGMSFVIVCIWGTQLFLAGLPFRYVFGLGVLGVVALVLAYAFFPHATARIDRFLNPGAKENYQVEKAIEAFKSGGLIGVGPGEGRVKDYLPDAHADTILAVAGEEFGLIPCLLIVFLFGLVVIRGFYCLMRETDMFVVLAGSGLFIQFGIQAMVNMASTLNLIPTKGMTLPFISYGGSSMLALGISIGMALALTRRRQSSRKNWQTWQPQPMATLHQPRPIGKL